MQLPELSVSFAGVAALGTSLGTFASSSAQISSSLSEPSLCFSRPYLESMVLKLHSTFKKMKSHLYEKAMIK